MVITVTALLGSAAFLIYLAYLAEFTWASRRDWTLQPTTPAAQRARRVVGFHIRNPAPDR